MLYVVIPQHGGVYLAIGDREYNYLICNYSYRTVLYRCNTTWFSNVDQKYMKVAGSLHKF